MLLLLHLIKCCRINLYVTLFNSGYFSRIIFWIESVEMSWNVGDNRNVFLKLRTKLGLSHVVLTSSEQTPKKVSLTFVEIQELPEVGKFDSENEISCLRWIIFNGRTKVCVFCKTDTVYVGIMVYRYHNNIYMTDSDIELKATEYNILLQQKKYVSSYFEFFFKKIIVVETTHHNWHFFCWEMDVLFVVAVIQSHSVLKLRSPFK